MTASSTANQPHPRPPLPPTSGQAGPARSLTRFAWLSIAAAVITISMKMAAWKLTGSVGLLSDALESIVNLVAAVAALVALHVAEQEPDEDHAYGHGKAEYFASGLEGMLVVVAAATIVWAAIPRLFEPVGIESAGIGIAVSVVASLINLMVALRLFRAAKEYRSITLEADGKHLITDVWTSVGVVIGIGAVALTGWHRLDPIIALVVAANIVWTGYQLMRRSMLGLLDTAIPADELAVVNEILGRYRTTEGVETHALRTRQAASRRFVSLHVLVPNWWSVEHGHELAEHIEHDIRVALPGTTVFTHLEPIDDPSSWADEGLDGSGAASPDTGADGGERQSGRDSAHRALAAITGERIASLIPVRRPRQARA
ncbi:MAG TPA: cation diffusion facilitator family transporter [Thermomicrobiales bacterium]|nr:cation diffusion facilitator family transporter [Thermomicrobiales bacterium]